MYFIEKSELLKTISNKSYEEIQEICKEKKIYIKKGISTPELFIMANFKSIPETLHSQTNGIILEENTNRVVAMSQNNFIDLQSQNDIINTISNVEQSNLRIEYCEDGTIMRLYHYNGNWMTATTKCIDARESYWMSDKSFDAMFWNIFDKSLLDNLDTECTYVFVLLHKDNRIVVKHKTNRLIYISEIHNDTKQENYINKFPSVFGIKRPKVVDINKMMSSFDSIIDNSKRGMLIKIKTPETGIWSIYKYDFENFKNMQLVRGNTPDIRMRYLELLKDQDKLIEFEKNYKEHQIMFQFMKISIINVVNEIYNLYVMSHIKHAVSVTEEHIYYRTLRQLHAQYKLTNKPITINDVYVKFYSLNKLTMKNLLNMQ